MRINDYKNIWQDTEEFHTAIHEKFAELVDGDVKLKEHRDFIQNHVYGFGERSFWWVWKLIANELPEDAKFLEIGCFKGATLSLWQLLKPKSEVYGVTPLDNTGIDWMGDYELFIRDIHDRFNQTQPHIIKGLSEDPASITQAKSFAPYDTVYIDGGHEKHHIDNDLMHYPPLVKPGGYLVIDDAASFLNMKFGYFQGIIPVSQGLREWEETEIGKEFEFIMNVVHLMIFKRR